MTRTCFSKVLKDLDEKGVNVTAAEVRKTMDEFLAQVVAQIEGESKRQ